MDDDEQGVPNNPYAVVTSSEEQTAPLDLDPIEETLKAITPWPWEILAGDEGRRISSWPIRTLFGARADCVVARVEHDRPTADGDKVFLARAPEMVQALVTEVRRLRSLAEQMSRG